VLTGAVPDEQYAVLIWRFDQLVEAGFTPEHAEKLASNSAVDLHKAVALLEAGWPERLAFDVLR
jgi:hypothetical protein